MTRLFRLAMLSVALLGAPAWAADSYLTPAQLDLLALLPPPPAAGSALDRAEMAEVLAMQAARTPAQAAATVADARETVFDQFGALLGAKFTPAAAPLATALFERLGETEEAITGPAKKGFARLRPFQANAEVHPSAPLSTSGAYPSGHATRVSMMGIVLAAMLPEMRPAIWARADDYAHNRLIGGLHYTSDITAGMRSGTAAAAVLMADPAFRAEFAPARAELRHAMGMAE